METPLDFARLEPLITSRFPGSKPRIERIPAGLGDRRFYRVILDAADPGAPSSLIARIEPQSDTSRLDVPRDPRHLRGCRSRRSSRSARSSMRPVYPFRGRISMRSMKEST